MTEGLRQGLRIDDSPRSGAENMAIDQALMESVQCGGPPILRFYSWSPATLSLGYFQKAEQRTWHAASRSAPVLRRATGGGAILHDGELTYSLSLPIADRADEAVRQIYDQVHRAIRLGLSELGVHVQRFADTAAAIPAPGTDQVSRQRQDEPFLCFQRRTAEDLVLSGYKVVGSAQRRVATAVLQHGSILLDSSPLAPELPGINELTSQSITAVELRERLSRWIAEGLGIRWVIAQSSLVEPGRVAAIQQERYSNETWNFKR